MENPVQKLIMGMGAMAEMTHSFYTAMLKSGASPQEATEAMKAFVQAFWTDIMNSARRKQQKGDGQNDGKEA